MSDCASDERLCTLGYIVADDTLFLHSALSVLQTVHFCTRCTVPYISVRS